MHHPHLYTNMGNRLALRTSRFQNWQVPDRVFPFKLDKDNMPLKDQYGESP